MARIIEVLVASNGTTTIQTKGYSGSECLQASKALEQALGLTVNDHPTSEFYQSTTVPQSPIQQ